MFQTNKSCKTITLNTIISNDNCVSARALETSIHLLHIHIIASLASIASILSPLLLRSLLLVACSICSGLCERGFLFKSDLLNSFDCCFKIFLLDLFHKRQLRGKVHFTYNLKDYRSVDKCSVGHSRIVCMVMKDTRYKWSPVM